MRELHEWKKTLDKEVFRSIEADVVGAFSINEASGFKNFSDRLRFIQEHCEEKDPAKHFPGPDFEGLGMKLLPAFKSELFQKAESMCAKMHKLSKADLTWIAAKSLASNEELYEDVRNKLGHLEALVAAVKNFTP